MYAIDLLPSTPQVTGSTYNGHPRITWNADLANDLPAAPYHVYRYFRTCGSYFPPHNCGAWDTPEDLTPSGTSSTSFTADEVISCQNCAEGVHIAGYYVKTKDNQNNWSAESATLEFQVNVPNEDRAFVGGPTEELPTVFSMAQNYPNPFNPVTTFNYTLPVDVHVILKMYDVLGREVATLVDEVQRAGYKSVAFDAGKLASGVYIYKITAGSFVNVKKMIVAK